MVRLTKPTTPVQLEQAINNVILANPGIVQNVSDLLLNTDQCLGADVMNVDLPSHFPFEIVLTKADTPPTHPLYTLMGPIRLRHITAQGFIAGTRGHIPFYVMIYTSDQNDLRAYVPTSGNAIHPYTGELFGQNPAADDAIARRLGYPNYRAMDYSQPNVQDQFYDKTLLIQNILTTIQPKP